MVERTDNFDARMLIEALDIYVGAKREYDDKKATCTGDWGYYGQRFESNVNGALNMFTDALNSYIDARVKAALDAHRKENS